MCGACAVFSRVLVLLASGIDPPPHDARMIAQAQAHALGFDHGALGFSASRRSFGGNFEERLRSDIPPRYTTRRRPV